MLKVTVEFQVNKLPEHCGKCAAFKTYTDPEEPDWQVCLFHSMGIADIDRYGCCVERPKECPLLTNITYVKKVTGGSER